MGSQMRTKRKKNDISIRGVNEKYVKLLSTTYDKYKDITILKRREEIHSDQGEEETTVKVINTRMFGRSKFTKPLLKS